MSAIKRRREMYQDLENEALGIKPVYKTKVPRVRQVYEQFKSLSQIEKDNFINLLQNNKL